MRAQEGDLGFISPSRLADLRECPRRVELRSRRVGEARASGGYAATLGLVAHETLEQLVRSNVPLSEWIDKVDGAWHEALEAAAERVGDLPGSASQQRRALGRLKRRVLPLLQQVVEESGVDVELLPEVPLSAFGGRLRGQADLIVRGEHALVVVDLKTGLVIHADGSGAREVDRRYEEQIQLYAAMVGEHLGRDPTRAVLISSREGLVDIDVDPSRCQEVVHQALRALDDYDERLPGPQPAYPSPSICRWCDVAEECEAFWEVISPGWLSEGDPGGGAVRGVVVGSVEASASGSLAVTLAPSAGTIDGPEALLTGLDPSAAVARPGLMLAAVNLVQKPGSSVARASSVTRVLIQQEGGSSEVL